jgi:hypothetical protein
MYIAHGFIRSITKDSGARVLTLSSGHVIRCTADNVIDDNITNGEFRFFLTEGKTPKDMWYKSSRICTDTKKLGTLHLNLVSATEQCSKSLKQLNQRDRILVGQAVGIAVSGTVSVISAVNAVAAVVDGVATSTFEPTAFLGSAVVSAGAGIYTAIQYESLEHNLQTRAALLKKVKKAHKLYANLLRQYIPYGGTTAEHLSPNYQSLIGSMRDMFQFSHNWSFFDGLTFNSKFAGASA